MELAKRVQNLQPSLTLSINARAKELKREGKPVISLGAGEPDFDTPKNIKEKAIQAINDGFTKYCPVGGTPELKKAIQKKYNQEYGAEINLSQVIVSCGAKHSLFNIFLAILNPGDEVIIPAPYWVSYPEMVSVAGGKPLILPAEAKNDFKVTPEQIRKVLNPRVKAFILNSPSNPTGTVYSAREVQALMKMLSEYPLYIISDEIYEKLIYTDEKYFSAAYFPELLKDRLLIVNGVSKTYSMTGWRIGYTLGPEPVVKAMTNIQGQSTSNPTSISMVAAEEALEGPQDAVGQMREEFRQRRDLSITLLREIPGINCFTSQGAFYLFPEVGSYFGKKTGEGKVIPDGIALAGYLLDKAMVATVPGVGFGAAEYLRLSFAIGKDALRTALTRIKSALADLV